MNETNKIRSLQLKKLKDYDKDDVAVLNENLKIDNEPQKATESKSPHLFHQERDILRILVEYSELEMTEELSVGEYVIFELVDIEFKHPSFQKLVKYYIDAYQNETPFSELKNVQNIEEQDVKDLMVELLSSPYELSSNWFDRHEIVVKDANRTYKTDVVSVMTRFRYYKMMEAIKILDEKIKTTEQNGQFEEMMAALLKKMELMEARKKLAKEISTVIHPH